MTTHNSHLVDGVANGVISKGQFVKYAAGGWVACSAITDVCDGVAFSDAVAAGAVCIQQGGKVTYLVGAANIADGALIGTSAAGVGQTAVSTQFPRLRAAGAALATAYGEAYWVSDMTVVP